MTDINPDEVYPDAQQHIMEMAAFIERRKSRMGAVLNAPLIAAINEMLLLNPKTDKFKAAQKMRDTFSEAFLSIGDTVTVKQGGERYDTTITEVSDVIKTECGHTFHRLTGTCEDCSIEGSFAGALWESAVLDKMPYQ